MRIIRSVLWEKFIALSALSATTSLLRAPMGAILVHPETRALQRQLVEETVAVSEAFGVRQRAGLAQHSACIAWRGSSTLASCVLRAVALPRRLVARS